MVYNGYYKVMSNIPKMGHLPTPVLVYSSLGSADVKTDVRVFFWDETAVPALLM